jgi:hypothetical protein
MKRVLKALPAAILIYGFWALLWSIVSESVLAGRILFVLQALFLAGMTLICLGSIDQLKGDFMGICFTFSLLVVAFIWPTPRIISAIGILLMNIASGASMILFAAACNCYYRDQEKYFTPLSEKRNQ